LFGRFDEKTAAPVPGAPPGGYPKTWHHFSFRLSCYVSELQVRLSEANREHE
jgi:hypothetical protein